MRSVSGARHCVPRGMALMAAIMMFVLIGASVVAMTTLFATQARRTRAATAGAQLRQLLLAGALFAGDQLQANGSAPHAAAVPTPLSDATLRLEITPDGPAAANVRLLAIFHGQHAAQLLRFERHGAAWTPAAATLRE